jgi:hypothetical protein
MPKPHTQRQRHRLPRTSHLLETHRNQVVPNDALIGTRQFPEISADK